MTALELVIKSFENMARLLASVPRASDGDVIAALFRDHAKATLDERKILSVLPEQRGSQPVVVERHDDLGGGIGRDRTTHERSGVGCTSCQRSNLLCRPMPDPEPPRGPTLRIDCSIRHR